MSSTSRSNSPVTARSRAARPSDTTVVAKPLARRPFSTNALIRLSSSATRIRPLI